MFGGVPKGRQARAMANGVDVLVATPGRLIDHMQDRAVRLDSVEVLVLDEADHMLDLGFIVPIRRIASQIPAQRQTLFFSATMPKEIGTLAGGMLKDPVHVAVAPVATTAERVRADRDLRRDRPQAARPARPAARRHHRPHPGVHPHQARRRPRGPHLAENGIPAAAIHGNKSQPQRERALADFRSGPTRVLIATDIAARGIDVDGVTHVINYDLPNVPEAYVHRIGRTARAGAAGVAISLCDNEERAFLRGIEKLIRTRVPVMTQEQLAQAA